MADIQDLTNRAGGIIKGEKIICRCPKHRMAFRPGASSAVRGSIECTRCNTVLWSDVWPRRGGAELYDWPALRKTATATVEE